MDSTGSPIRIRIIKCSLAGFGQPANIPVTLFIHSLIFCLPSICIKIEKTNTRFVTPPLFVKFDPLWPGVTKLIDDEQSDRNYEKPKLNHPLDPSRIQGISGCVQPKYEGPRVRGYTRTAKRRDASRQDVFHTQPPRGTAISRTPQVRPTRSRVFCTKILPKLSRFQIINTRSLYETNQKSRGVGMRIEGPFWVLPPHSGRWLKGSSSAAEGESKMKLWSNLELSIIKN